LSHVTFWTKNNRQGKCVFFFIGVFRECIRHRHFSQRDDCLSLTVADFTAHHDF